MWKTLRQIARVGRVSEPLAPPGAAVQVAEPERLQAELRQLLGRALAVRQIDAGSCNGCELEINALGNPYYNLEGQGVHFVASPRHADMLLVTGPVTEAMRVPLLRAWEACPEPRLVVAAGDCALGCGVFDGAYGCGHGVASVLPVDVTVAGCPPTPSDLLAGILAAVGRRG